MPGRVRFEITHPFPIFNGTTVEVWEWINDFSRCISLVHETIDDMHFSTDGNIILTVRELPVNSLGQLYAFPLTDRHSHSPTDTGKARNRGLSWRAFTPFRWVSFLEKESIALPVWPHTPALLKPETCKSGKFLFNRFRLFSNKSIGISVNGCICPPPLSTVDLCNRNAPATENSRLEKLGSRWCFGTHWMTSYCNYSLKSNQSSHWSHSNWKSMPSNYIA